ncbi:hypothetical protein AAFL23_05715 [Staphylococcus lugdunensis]|nr:hypothetical protein [Staphylococcus lugdunensis]EHS02610.1 hypothetical protein SEVCU139_0742 [Staphylococcus lugdunensis VCU139]KAK59052.1 hypothetical protein SLVCU148_0758 [Staphylococcus lugdunensis VCU148]MDK7913762.1 hypothetical protein [Staphylococcus lugdunensis]BBN85746.1 hypothetical protein MRSL_18410 [Staphylococcus lugdunensis]
MQEAFLQTTQVGVGPQQREMQEAFLRTTQVGDAEVCLYMSNYL